MGWGDAAFALASIVAALLAHAVAYLTHEYAHSVMAWAMGWMERPFGIDYGPPTPMNLLMLGEVSDNVDYARIFAAGHGYQGAIIALSGPFLGNGMFYLLACWLCSGTWLRARRGMRLFVYWFALMCAANVWSYVPLRALTSHGDIALAAQGIGVSTGWLLPFLLIPSAAISWHFFARLAPSLLPTLAVDWPRAVLLIALGTFWYFVFFSGDAVSGSYGAASQLLAWLWRYVGLPVAALYLAGALRRRSWPLPSEDVHSPQPGRAKG